MLVETGALTGENFGCGAITGSAGANQGTAAVSLTGVRRCSRRADGSGGQQWPRRRASRLAHNRHRSVHQRAGNGTACSN